MMHLHLLKPQTQFIGTGNPAASTASGAQRHGGACGKGHAETILIYSVPTKQVGAG